MRHRRGVNDAALNAAVLLTGIGVGFLLVAAGKALEFILYWLSS